MNRLVTIEEFKQQVWDVEGVRIDIKPRDGQTETLVTSYNFDRLPDDATVDDLLSRINSCLNLVHGLYNIYPLELFMGYAKINEVDQM